MERLCASGGAVAVLVARRWWGLGRPRQGNR